MEKLIMKSIKEDELLGLCPFHKEQTPSFLVNKKTDRYHCLGCGDRGDAEMLRTMYDIVVCDTLPAPVGGPVTGLVVAPSMPLPKTLEEALTQLKNVKNDALQAKHAASAYGGIC